MYLHVFSHIRRSNHVEKMTVVVVGGSGLEQLRQLEGAASASAVPQGEGLEGLGQGQALGVRGKEKTKVAAMEVIDLSSDEEEDEEEEAGARPAKKDKKQAKAYKAPSAAQRKAAAAGGKGVVMARGAELRWVRVADMAGAGLPTLTQKIFKQAST